MLRKEFRVSAHFFSFFHVLVIKQLHKGDENTTSVLHTEPCIFRRKISVTMCSISVPPVEPCDGMLAGIVLYFLGMLDAKTFPLTYIYLAFSFPSGTGLVFYASGNIECPDDRLWHMPEGSTNGSVKDNVVSRNCIVTVVWNTIMVAGLLVKSTTPWKTLLTPPGLHVQPSIPNFTVTLPSLEQSGGYFSTRLCGKYGCGDISQWPLELEELLHVGLKNSTVLFCVM